MKEINKKGINCIVCKKVIPNNHVAMICKSDSGRVLPVHMHCHDIKNTYYQLTMHEHKLVQTLKNTLDTIETELQEHSGDEEFEEIQFSIIPVKMTQVEFELLPEFGGF